jgi:adenylate cyclase
LGDAYKINKQLAQAIQEGHRSIELGPSCAQCYGELAEHLMCAGEPAQALPLLDKALRLDPVDYRPDYKLDLVWVHLHLGKRAQAIDEVKQILIHQPNFSIAHAVLAVLYADAGLAEQAKSEAAKWLKLISPLTIPKIRELVKQNDICADQAEQKHGLDTLERLTTGVRQNG